METDIPRQQPPPVPLRRFIRTPFQFSLLLTSVLSAKFLHLYTHITSLPVLLYLLYLPTFLALDALSALFFWIIVHLTIPGRLWILLALARGWLCFLLLASSSAQIAFYMETGAEIKWGAAKSLASDPDGFKVALTGGVQATFVSIVIVIVAWVISQPIYNGFQKLSTLIVEALPSRQVVPWVRSKETSEGSSMSARPSSEEDCLPLSRRGSVEAEPLLSSGSSNVQGRRWLIRLIIIAPIIGVCILLSVRPRNFPYGHMSNSLPFTLAEVWSSFDGDMCQGSHLHDFPHFPIESLLSKEYWEAPDGKYPGWRPMANITVAYQSKNHMLRPVWLGEELVQGLERWSRPREQRVEVTSHGKTYHPAGPPPDEGPGGGPGHGQPDLRPGHGPPRHGPPGHGPPRHGPHGYGPPGHGPGHRPGRRPRPGYETGFEGLNYDPVTDPLKISNLDQAILVPIHEALKERDIKIKHIVFLALESTRKDVFPFKKDSNLHKIITESHGSAEGAAKASEALSELTLNAEILSGEASGFDLKDVPHSQKNTTWRQLSADRGGINVQGAFTGSTTSLKSFLESHCGVQPLAVDFTVEVDHTIYQPCIPSILKIFNNNKGPVEEDPLKKLPGFGGMPWKSVYVQAITDQFDHQYELNEEVGFDQIIVKNTLLDPKSKHFPPLEKQSNYFGFPETQVKPYLKDAILEAEKANERLFLSHLTSTTHHPWNLPEAAGQSTEYLKQGRWRKEHELNRYLNTIKYIDNWIGDIMDLLEETGVAEQTLVVMVGDHGMAFEEDAPVHTTFENGHISNMRVPLNFYHPSLPRIQLHVNATSLSIIPTILDLLVATDSLNSQDSNTASDLIQQYEGQSLIRPYQVRKNGRQAWNIAVLNAGGAFLSVSSAAVPFRLVIPICKAGVYRFTHNDLDPNEVRPLEANSVAELVKRTKNYYGDEASEWVDQAEQVGKWWVLEQRRRWRFRGASLQNDRSPEELMGAGTEKKEHWWDT